jgi:solute:Na+ symporter, SSS family
MSSIDWCVLIATLLAIVSYGLYKSKTSKNLEGYFLSNRSMPWYLVLLGIMGTQASAITFLSAPGQAFTDGMRFVQYYFGLPIAMMVLCITFVPLFNKLQVFTAYEFLEQRFNVKTRLLTSALFLISRGLSTGISIYAPSIILSSLLGWDIFTTNIVMGGLLIVYTVSGGAKAVAYTQQIQLLIIFLGLIATGYFIVHLMPENIGFTEALAIGGAANKLNIITTGFTNDGFDIKDRYNIVSGTIGGFFLALSYFGTDQSQVGRYLTAKNTTESKLGLLMNGLVKVPMQFLILLLGVLLFAFYQFAPKPIFFNKSVEEKAVTTNYQPQLQQLKQQYQVLQTKQQWYTKQLSGNAIYKDSIRLTLQQQAVVQKEYKAVLKKAVPTADTNDTNYIFLRFVIDYLPKGLVGLLIAIIFLAAWGSIAAALNALASCTMIDFHQRYFGKKNEHLPTAVKEKREYQASKWYTFAWGIFCIVTAQLSSGLGSLIEAVNVLGSLFYGVILGIFLVAFYLRSISGKAVFIAAIIGEIIVVTLFVLDANHIIGLGFLWLNVVGALVVCLLAYLLQLFMPKKV